MPLIKLNRINKGGEILLNSEHIVYAEVESRTTTIHMTDGLFSVEEPLSEITDRIEKLESERIARGLMASGLGPATSGNATITDPQSTCL